MENIDNAPAAILTLQVPRTPVAFLVFVGKLAGQFAWGQINASGRFPP